nr:retrovirus-related Pol polyprotein from transposon TNT 1-94 [Tanacetum cinerariifolium]
MNERAQKQSFNRVSKGRTTVRTLFEAMHGLTLQRKRVVKEMGFGNLIDFLIVEIRTKLAFYVIDILNTRKMTLECPMGDIVITPKTMKEVLGLPMGRKKLEREGQKEYNDSFLEEWKDQFKNINKLTIKALSDLIIDIKNTDYMFRMNILTLIANTLGSCEDSSSLNFTVLRNVFEGDDVKKKRMKKRRMKVIFKEPNIPEYHSSSSTESDDDKDDNSQVGDDNEKSYETKTDSVQKGHVQIVTTEAQQEERNNLGNKDFQKDEANNNKEELKNEQEMRTSKNDEADNNKEERMENKKATNQKINKEIDPFDDPTFGEYYLQNEHLFVPTQTSVEKKKDQTDDVNWDSFLKNAEEIVPGILEDKITKIDKKIDAQYDRFHEMLSIQMENNIEKMEMEDVELNYVRKFLRALHFKWRAKVMTIEGSKDLTSLSLDEHIENLKVHEMIIKKDSKIVKAKVERKSLSLKAKKESSDEEFLTFGSKDEEHSKEAVMTRTEKVIEHALDVATRIILLENVQNHQQIRTKEHLSEILRAIAVKKMMRRVDLEPDEWIKDSGCYKRMTGNRKLFSSYKAYNRGNVIFGNNLRGNIIGKGYSQNSKAYIILNKHTRKVEESLNVTFDETPPSSKTSPLVDDDLDEDEAIKIIEKKNLENDIVDETLEIEEIVNIKESKNHPLENNLNEALGDESWIVAMQEELSQFIANDVWELVPQPRNMTIIGTKWVFRNKLDENDVVSRNKARLVAQGYNQQEGIDYDKTYAPVARLEFIMILLAYACALDFKLFQMDVKSAFLDDFINEEVYVAQPSGFIDFEKPDHVYKLKKALYGLKQAPKA